MRSLLSMLATFLVVITTFGIGNNAHIQGMMSTESGNQDRRPLHWKDVIQYLDPERTLFTQLLTRLDTVKVSSSTFKLFEREHPNRWIRLAEALDNSETGVDVDDGSFFRAGDIVMVCETGERMLVSSISTNTLTVTRGALGTTATAASDNGWLLLLFQRQMEGGTSPTSIRTDYQTITNHAQILKRSHDVSNSRKAEKLRGPSDESEDKKTALDLFKRDIEHMILWGKKRIENTDGTIYRYSGGLDEFITTNRISVDGALGFGDIGWLVNQSTRYGGKKKIWFCGRDARVQLDSLGLEFMRIKAEDNVLGMAVDGVRTSFGEFMLVTHHGLENGLADRIYIIDPEHVALAVFRAMKYETGIQTNETDGIKNQFIGEMGLYMSIEKAHTVVTGLTNAII